MYCSKCGAMLPSDSTQCGVCGAVIAAQTSDAPVYNPAQSSAPAQAAPAATATPAYNPGQPIQTAAPSAPAVSTVAAAKVGKNKYLFTLAPIKTRVLSWTALAITLACLLVLVLGALWTYKAPIDEIPVVALASTIADSNEDLDDLQDDLEKYTEHLDEMLYDYRHQLTNKEYKALKKVLDCMEDCADTPSFHNLLRFYEQFKDVDDELLEEYADVQLADDEEDAIDIATSVVPLVLFGLMGIAALFTALGGFFRINGLVITGLIFSFFYTMIFCAMPYFVLNLILHIALIVLIRIINRTYKNDRITSQFGV